MQSPLGTGIDQLIGHERLQDGRPGRAFTRGWQARLPEGIEPKLPPQHVCEPTGTPLARTLQLQFVEPNADGRGIIGRCQGFWEQRHLTQATSIEDINALAPRRLLAVVDLS